MIQIKWQRAFYFGQAPEAWAASGCLDAERRLRLSPSREAALEMREGLSAGLSCWEH